MSAIKRFDFAPCGDVNGHLKCEKPWGHDGAHRAHFDHGSAHYWDQECSHLILPGEIVCPCGAVYLAGSPREKE